MNQYVRVYDNHFLPSAFKSLMSSLEILDLMVLRNSRISSK
ncbi:MAG: hypothetical protein OZSIB_1287 [Candidatus Ozemobacter sibiricus]|uniref:Uncharacterized protein n=1 Tax=Candidatus Ozemobacter sibiricus TaxID=2268124 RepID=A0A367ZKB7_9BACT|nr:MAG: hypothetical protein OZSIB_1287 [Candidatus Ozemobacter sibiricus]